MASRYRYQQGRREMVSDFSGRAQAYHQQQFQRDLEKAGVEGQIQKDINLALQNLRNKGAVDVTRMETEAMAPLRSAQAREIEQGIRSSRFDLRMAEQFVPSLLGSRATQSRLETDYLRRYLGQPQGATPAMGNIPVSPITGKRPTGFKDFGPFGRLPLYEGVPDSREIALRMQKFFPGPFLGTERKKKVPRATELLEMMEIGP